ncbi:DUF2281 domain-containing protein [Iningainema tapete]|uniref:DUF2281 domain-containing protein n=1 Tax=Iningainema tapete BLCC-T55 TaxID=2748662 RepID=A0A8J6XK98_9CYAN|nr:DUF2281 domain-containing protein [Iningainema tapete]MBD2774340.1 DUF2281 domain-containing protein [Iningainema tapete BLCC-T55]
MQPIQQQVIETLQTLSVAEQQEVLDFAEFLKSKRQRLSSMNQEPAQSFLETAQAYIGAGIGPGDLSTNPKYMEGYGA